MAGMRRPPLVIGAAGVAVLVLASILLAVLGPPQRLRPLPFASDSSSPIAPGTVPAGTSLLPARQRSTTPVLLVHGYAGLPSQMNPLAARLTADGRRVVIVPLPKRGTVDIHISALTVFLAAKSLRAPVVDVVGFSLGGVAARQWLLLPDTSVRIRHLVMLATPNLGVELPDDSGRPEAMHCEPDNACGQLKPFSPFLRELDENPAAKGRPGWLTVASLTDRLVRPPSIVALQGADNLVLQDVCPDARVDHGQMDDTPAILGLVSLFLDDRLPRTPTCEEALGAAGA
jgi:triacylglycerol lipase